jgi:DNA polymerase III epsilon subunit-like protein
MVLIIDTETTGLEGYPRDRVLEIGIAEYDELSHEITPVYSDMIRYDDIRRFDSRYVNRDGSRGIWIYRNSDMTIEDTLNAEKDLSTVVEEVRGIVHGKAITAYNVGFDFWRFLYHEPWSIKMITARRYDIMDLVHEPLM